MDSVGHNLFDCGEFQLKFIKLDALKKLAQNGADENLKQLFIRTENSDLIPGVYRNPSIFFGGKIDQKTEKIAKKFFLNREFLNFFVKNNFKRILID